MNKKPLLPVKSDFVFKLIFGDQRNADILSSFLMAVLDIPEDEYDRLTIIDPHVKKESKDDKFSILDVKLHTKTGKIVHIEIQISPIPEMKERSIFQQSKMITEQMAAGRDWSSIKRVISIIITDYDLIPENKKYHHQFRYRTIDGIGYTDLTEINTLELSKLPQTADDSELWFWMKFIKSDDEEALNMIAEKNPQMRKAVGILKELSADERTRMLLEAQETHRKDVASMIGGARREGLQEGRHLVVQNALDMGLDIETISKLTGLTHEEIENLKS